MAVIKIPIKIDGFQCIEEMVQTVLNYTYKGRTLKEWADSISEPQTNADRIRAMTDEELANEIFYILDHVLWMYNDSRLGLLDWLKQEAQE